MNKFVEAFKSLLGQKRGRLLLLLFAAGILLLIVSSSVGGEEAKASRESLEEYEARLEQQLAELCSGVEGAGKCRVMVSFSRGEVREYKSGELISSEPPTVQGVTVLCKGADRASVKADISELISALYGIGANRICVLKLS